MVEDFFGPAAALRLRSTLLGPYTDQFCSSLVGRGHPAHTIKKKLYIVRRLAHWMMRQHLSVVDLCEQRIDEFVDMQTRYGRVWRGYYATALLLLGQLRSAEVVPTPEPTFDSSPFAELLTRYEGYLRHERALAEYTVSAYLGLAREFIVERVGARAGRLDSLHAADVRDFLLARVHRMGPQRAQHVRAALRSFLRFLFVRAEISVDLALAMPMVRQWRLASVPRHISQSDVERLLQACDLSSATGRRDRAILLLLARLGLRAGEVIALELGDVRWREGEILVRGKGLVRDRLPLLHDVGEALARYIQTDRPPSNSRRIFLCRRAPLRGFAHPATVSTIVRRALDRAGLAAPTHGAHLLRHSLATAMIRRGASLTEIGQVLRHRSPGTTEIYAKLDFEALRDVAMPWPTGRGDR